MLPANVPTGGTPASMVTLCVVVVVVVWKPNIKCFEPVDKGDV